MPLGWNFREFHMDPGILLLQVPAESPVMGLFTAAMGLQMFLKTTNPLVVLGKLRCWNRFSRGGNRLSRAMS